MVTSGHLPASRIESSISTLSELREQGKIRHVGLSNVTIDQLWVGQKSIPIVSVQNRYNIFDARPRMFSKFASETYWPSRLAAWTGAGHQPCSAKKQQD